MVAGEKWTLFSPYCMECLPQTTLPAATQAPARNTATEPIIAPEPEPQDVSGVCTGNVCIAVRVLVGIEGFEGSPTPAAEGELFLDSTI